jgi:alcohol dehydrogenase class IV
MADLFNFYKDKEGRENVYNYIIDFLEKTAIKKTFAKADTMAVAEAKEIIDEAFKNLEVMFEPKPKKKELKNQAR